MADFDPADDQEVRVDVNMDFSLVTITQMVRNQLLKDGRRLGNLFGPRAAQKKTPLASKPQAPGTQRVF
jgi:hypothetical protein